MRGLQPRLFGALDLDDLPVMNDDSHRAKAQTTQRFVDMLEGCPIRFGESSSRQLFIGKSLSFHGFNLGQFAYSGMNTRARRGET